MESKLFKKLKRATPGFHWQAHEDKFTSGISDLSYGVKGVCGWVELKTYDRWPRDPHKVVPFSDLKPTQVNWSIKRGRACGRVWFLVSFGDDWILISWRHARKLGKLTRGQLLAYSDIVGRGSITKDVSKLLSGEEDD